MFSYVFSCRSLSRSHTEGKLVLLDFAGPSPLSLRPQPQPLAFTVVIPTRTMMPSRGVLCTQERSHAAEPKAQIAGEGNE